MGWVGCLSRWSGSKAQAKVETGVLSGGISVWLVVAFGQLID